MPLPLSSAQSNFKNSVDVPVCYASFAVNMTDSRRCIFVLTSALLLHGCITGTDSIYYRPSGEGRITFEEFDCYYTPNTLQAEVAQGVRIALRAESAVFSEAGFSDHQGITLFGEVFVPAGVTVKFMTPTFSFRSGSGQRARGTIARITRTIWSKKEYPNRKGKFYGDSLQQTLLPGDTLKGWSADEMRALGMAPFMPRHYQADSAMDRNNKFGFYVPVEEFTASSFTVDVPDISVNDQVVAGKPVVFTAARWRKWSMTCP